MFDVQADGQKLIDVRQRLPGGELGEEQVRREAIPDVVRQIHPIAEVGLRKLVPGGRYHHTVKAQGLTQTAHQIALSAGERRSGPHADGHIGQVHAGAAIVVDDLELHEMFADRGERVRGLRCRCGQGGAIGEVPHIAHQLGSRGGGRWASVEVHGLPRTDQGGRLEADVHGGHRPRAWHVAADRAGKDPGAAGVAVENEGQTTTPVGGGRRNDLSLEGIPRIRPQHWGRRTVPIVNGQHVDGCGTGRGQVEREHVHRDRIAGIVRAQRIGVVLVVPVSGTTLSAAVQECSRAGQFRAIEDLKGLSIGQKGEGPHQQAKEDLLSCPGSGSPRSVLLREPGHTFPKVPGGWTGTRLHAVFWTSRRCGSTECSVGPMCPPERTLPRRHEGMRGSPCR